MNEDGFHDRQITVAKVTAYVPVSAELLADCALDLDALLNPTRWQRLRGRWRALRRRAGERAYRLITGRDVPEPEPADWDDDE